MLDIAEETISKLDDIPMESIIQNETQQDKKKAEKCLTKHQ